MDFNSVLYLLTEVHSCTRVTSSIKVVTICRTLTHRFAKRIQPQIIAESIELFVFRFLEKKTKKKKKTPKNGMKLNR